MPVKKSKASEDKKKQAEWVLEERKTSEQSQEE